MNDDSDDYRIATWRAEFANRDTELSFQKQLQAMTNRQIRIVLIVWGALMLLFALPDYVALGATRHFYYLLAYRTVMVLALLVTIFRIRHETDFDKISYAVTALVIAGFTGFMMLFYYRPDAIVWTVGVIMLQIIVLLIFIPIRFCLAFAGGLFGVVITLATRWSMGSPKANLIGLIFMLMLPLILGAATSMRLGISQRRAFVLLEQTKRINRELELEIHHRLKLEAELKKLAATDPLTGLFNRREYETLFRHEVDRARRAGSPLSVCIIDLDHFKKVNDTYGHGVGDEVLRRTADLCRMNLRTVDILGRLGGEEFILLLPETAIDQAVNAGNRLLKAIASAGIEAGASVIRITATIGIS